MSTSATMTLRLARRVGGLNSLLRLSPRTLCSQVVPRLSPLQAVSCRGMATKGDSELGKFLTEEIATEKRNARAAPKLEGWTVKTDGAEVSLSREGASPGEKVLITLNVNDTVDSAEPDDGSEEAPEMLSKPSFEVDIIKSNGRTLSFTCSYTHQEEPQAGQQQGQEEEMDDVFAIDE